MILTTTCLEYFVRLGIFNIDQPFQDGTFEIELFIIKVLVGRLIDEVIFFSEVASSWSLTIDW